MNERPTSGAPGLLLLIAGFIIWAIGHAALYGMLSIGCAAGWWQVALGPLSVQRLMLLAIWAVHVAAIAYLLAWLWRGYRAEKAQGPGPIAPTGRFLWLATIASTVAALISMVWTGLPILAASPCL